MKKSKIVALALAGTLTTTALLAGTYAWTAISQVATNELIETLNPGGRLHDDFNGKNKDVYVENFTDPEGGGLTIFARIKMKEYMETGDKAGQPTNTEGKSVKPLVTGAVFDEPDTWTTYQWNKENDVFRDYFELEMGGSSIYMPTYNKNKDSLEADINGTLGGTDQDINTAPAFDDYVSYKLGQTKTGNAEYDADDNVVDEKSVGVPNEENVNYTIASEQHEAKETLETLKIMSMEEWIAAGSKPGAYWVYDTDGWAYWAQGIEPGTATGCLLNGIKRQSALTEEYYYAINVIAQFATAGDWGNEAEETGFYKDGETFSSNARYLLETVAKTERKIEITTDTEPPSAGMTPETTLQFQAKVLQGTTELGDTVSWRVSGAVSSGTSISETGLLTIGEDETSDSIIVTAISNGTQAVEGSYTVLVGDWYTVEVDTADGENYAAKGKTREFKASVIKEGTLDKSIGVTWSLEGNYAAGTLIDNVTGALTVDAEETVESVVVVATCRADGVTTGKYTVDIISHYEYISYMDVGTMETVSIDGISWYVLKKNADNSQALLWASDSLASEGKRLFDETDETGKDNVWETSSIRTYLNSEFLAKLSELSTHVEETRITTRNEYNATSDDQNFIPTDDNIFFLSEADIFGTFNGDEEADVAKDYTYNGEIVLPEDPEIQKEMRKAPNGVYWLRSPGYGVEHVALAWGSTGEVGYYWCQSNKVNIRPAMWIRLGE